MVTGSGLNPALSFTRRSLDNHDELNVTLQNTTDPSPQAPVQSSSVQVRAIDGWDTAAMNGINSSVIANSDVSDFILENAIDGKHRILTSTKAFSQEVSADNAFNQVFNQDNKILTIKDDLNSIDSQPPLQVGSNNVFNESVIFNFCSILSNDNRPSELRGLFCHGGVLNQVNTPDSPNSGVLANDNGHPDEPIATNVEGSCNETLVARMMMMMPLISIMV